MEEREEVQGGTDMRIYKLTNLVLDLIASLCSEKRPDITNDDVRRRIEDGTIFEFLNDRLGFSGAISVLDPVDRLELMLEWDYLRGRMEPFSYDVPRNGLRMLVDLLMEGIVRRSESRDYRLTPEMCGAAVPGGELNSIRDD
jgi:hypothetical protein